MLLQLLKSSFSYFSEIDASVSLVEQDLSFLSEGLEGRSSNPIAVLFDALTSPDADLGADLPSCVDFQHLPQNVIPHAVFGKGAPGKEELVMKFEHAGSC